MTEPFSDALIFSLDLDFAVAVRRPSTDDLETESSFNVLDVGLEVENEGHKIVVTLRDENKQVAD